MAGDSQSSQLSISTAAWQLSSVRAELHTISIQLQRRALSQWSRTITKQPLEERNISLSYKHTRAHANARNSVIQPVWNQINVSLSASDPQLQLCKAKILSGRYSVLCGWVGHNRRKKDRQCARQLIIHLSPQRKGTGDPNCLLQMQALWLQQSPWKSPRQQCWIELL